MLGSVAERVLSRGPLRNPNASGTSSSRSPNVGRLRSWQEVRAMWDIWVIAITSVFFALAFALVRWFDRI